MFHVPVSSPTPGSRRDAIEWLVRQILELLRRGALSAIRERLASDFVHCTRGNWSTWPFPAGPIDRPHYVDALQRLNAEIEILRSVIHEIVIDGDSAAIHRTVTARRRGTGPTTAFDMWMVWRFRGDLAVESATYVDLAGAARPLGGQPIEVRPARPTMTRAGEASRRPTPLDGQGERQAIERAIGRIFDWRDRCDEASILTLLAPDFQFETRGTWSIKPLGAARLSQLAFADALKRLNIEVETIERAYDDVLIDGDAAAVRWTASVRNRGTGPTHTLGSWAYFRFREGQMIECAYYPDSGNRATELGPPFKYSRSLSVQEAG